MQYMLQLVFACALCNVHVELCTCISNYIEWVDQPTLFSSRPIFLDPFLFIETAFNFRQVHGIQQ